MKVLRRVALVSITLMVGVLVVSMIRDSLEDDRLWHRVEPESNA